MEWLIFALFVALVVAGWRSPGRERHREDPSDPLNVVQRREEEE